MGGRIRKGMERLALLGGPPARATLLPYAQQTIEPDDLAAVSEALASDWITQGPIVARFGRALAELAGAKHAVAVANGTAALHGASSNRCGPRTSAWRFTIRSSTVTRSTPSATHGPAQLEMG